MNTLTVSDVYVGLFSNYLEQLKADRPELNLDEIIIPTTLETGSECVTLDALENLVKAIVTLTRNQALGVDVGAKIHIIYRYKQRIKHKKSQTFLCEINGSAYTPCWLIHVGKYIRYCSEREEVYL